MDRSTEARCAPGGVRVEEIQRARILGAMAELVCECGPGAVTVARVVARSGISRRTFYELFGDREDCFLATFDMAVARVAVRVVQAYRTQGAWCLRVRAGLEALLGFLDDEPELGYLCVVGALGGSGRVLERRMKVVRLLVDAVHEGRAERGARRPQRLVAEGVVGAVLAVIHARLVEQAPRSTAFSAGRATGGPLLELLNPLMGMIVLPYLGAAAAAREQRRATPRARGPRAPRADPLRELDMRLTYRTVRVLLAIAELAGLQPLADAGPSNRQVATAAGISDQGQISKLLSRLHALELIENSGGDHAKGAPNAWHLTPRGREVTRTLATSAALAAS